MILLVGVLKLEKSVLPYMMQSIPQCEELGGQLEKIEDTKATGAL